MKQRQPHDNCWQTVGSKLCNEVMQKIRIDNADWSLQSFHLFFECYYLKKDWQLKTLLFIGPNSFGKIVNGIKNVYDMVQRNKKTKLFNSFGYIPLLEIHVFLGKFY